MKNLMNSIAWLGKNPKVSVWGLLSLGKDRKNLVRILPKKVKSLVTVRKSCCEKSKEGRIEANEGRTKVDKEERA